MKRWLSVLVSLLCAAATLASAERAREPRRVSGRFNPRADRLECLYNGYILTADPARALSSTSSEARYRLFVLHGVLIHSETGRIIATFPALEGDAVAGDEIARPAELYQELQSEQPAAPGITAAQLIAYWRGRGIGEELLTDLDLLDLEGAVVTPGLIDDHFHVTSFSKKLPAEGQRFGFWADVGDPAYYTDTATWNRVCTRQALWQMVADANAHIADQDRGTIYLHGYWYGQIDDPPADPDTPETRLFATSQDCTAGTYNPDYLLNRIGRGPEAPLDPPPDPCGDLPSLPAPTYEILPALLVHTSGQMCWYNAALFETYNHNQEEILAARFPDAPLASASRPASDDVFDWSLELAGTGGAAELAAIPPSFRVDVVVERSDTGETLWVPFQVVEVSADDLLLTARPVLPEVADAAFNGPTGAMTVVPFWRSIVPCISGSSWDQAASWAGEVASNESLAYGHWDPRDPHGTNWYNGAERGLIEYAFDPTAEVWRPSGYAEHYVMRDALSALVVDTPTVEQGMEHRRRLAHWCHRHGLTAVNDIMFYRRSGNDFEFAAYEGLSFDHGMDHGSTYYLREGLETSVATGHFNLRVGLYYYLENAPEVDRMLELATDPTDGPDWERLRPGEHHPDFPGWVRWLGWKIQLDGGTGARTLFSNAPMTKTRADDPYPAVDEDGNELVFLNHSFGLLTMSNVQEQVFTSRESAALYWLVRESDPSSPHHNQSLALDWSFLAEGVAEWLGTEIDTDALSADLVSLQNVALGANQAAAMAAKVTNLLEQVADGFERTITAAAKIWYEHSMNPAIPSQTVTHCVGDGAVDLMVSAIRQLKEDVEDFPASWEELPSYWQAVIPADADLPAVRTTFDNQRFRIEHLLNVSGSVFDDITGDGGIDAASDPARRNVVFSVQPALLLLDGDLFHTVGFPYAQELWPIPTTSHGDLWLGLSSRPRAHHHKPCPVFVEHDVPFTLNTDPPAVRDPRPALTVIAAVARTPAEIDPSRWLDQDGDEPAYRPPDYLVGTVSSPLGLTSLTPDNPMQLTVEQALSAMTFWAAYVSGMEDEIGAIAAPAPGSDSPGRFADLVVWENNPLAITGPTGATLDELGRTAEGTNDAVRVATVNAFISKFRPTMTIVGGVRVYQRE